MNPTLAYTLLAAQTLYWLYYLWQRRPRPARDDSALLLLYASQGGQAETLAKHLAQNLNTRAESLDAWHAHHPLKMLGGKTLILIASTTGDGDPPDNAIRFTRSLQKSGAALADTRYHLLALGDKRYPHYCAYGHLLDQELERLGATRESPVTTVDNLDPQTIAYWQKQLGEHLQTTLDVPAQPPSVAATLARIPTANKRSTICALPAPNSRQTPPSSKSPSRTKKTNCAANTASPASRRTAAAASTSSSACKLIRTARPAPAHTTSPKPSSRAKR